MAGYFWGGMFWGGVDWLAINAIKGNGNFTIKKEDLWEGTFTKKVAGDFWSAVLDLPLTQDAIVNTRMTLHIFGAGISKSLHLPLPRGSKKGPSTIFSWFDPGLGLWVERSSILQCWVWPTRLEEAKSGSDHFTVIVGEQTRCDFFWKHCMLSLSYICMSVCHLPLHVIL